MPDAAKYTTLTTIPDWEVALGKVISDQELGPALRDGRTRRERGQEEGERETWTQKQVS